MSKHKYKPPAVRRGGQRPPGAALERVLASTATALVCVAAMLWARRSSSVRPAPAQSQYGWLQVEADEPLLKSRSNVAAVDARNFTAADVVEAILAEPGRPLLVVEDHTCQLCPSRAERTAAKVPQNPPECQGASLASRLCPWEIAPK